MQELAAWLPAWHSKVTSLMYFCAVRVDVDFLNPVVATVKESTAEIWAKLPAPVQQHGPIIGAVLLTAFQSACLQGSHRILSE